MFSDASLEDALGAEVAELKKTLAAYRKLLEDATVIPMFDAFMVTRAAVIGAGLDKEEWFLKRRRR